MMTDLQILSMDTRSLHIFVLERDLLRDLFIYLEYAREHNIKRMTRTNEIPRSDSVKIAKRMGDPEMVEAAQDSGGSKWIDFIDHLAYRLQLVRFDIKGSYRGYSSSEPSFTDNYINVDQASIEKFFKLAPVEQEKRILDVLIRARSFSEYDSPSFNEFYQTSVFGSLDPFSHYGSATGVMPTLDFPRVRHFLLDLLEKCKPGEWYSVESLVKYLKNNQPFFLIPQMEAKKDRWGNLIGRYSNFYEGKDRWSSDNSVPDNDPDAFERVEGRYVERFLEHIPLVMRFVDVAYDQTPYVGLRPMRGVLKAFRVNERFLRLCKGERTTPRVTVQPNFDVVVESDFFPAAIIQQLASLGELVSNPNSGHGAYIGIFQLKKTMVAAEQARQPNLNVAALLKELSGRDLPANVEIELDEWSSHAEQFILYSGFALLETVEFPRELEKYGAEIIAPGLRLVRSPEKVFATLETLGLAPIHYEHPDKEFQPVVAQATSIFPRQVEALSQKIIRPVRIGRVVTVNYQFPDDDVFIAIQKMLAEVRCPFHADAGARSISIQQKDQTKFDQAVLQLADDFSLEIE